LWSLAAIAGAAPVYKWVDADGVTHYDQQPPAQGNAQPFDPKVNPGVGTAKAREILEGLRKDLAASAAASAQTQADQAKTQVTRATRARRCEEARARLAGLHNAPRVAVQDAQGEYRRIDNDERATLVRQAEAVLRENCD
jgi:hypothetical protein